MELTRSAKTYCICFVLVGVYLLISLQHVTVKDKLWFSGFKHAADDVLHPKDTCSPETRQLLINLPLPIKVDKSVNIEKLENSGCFVINASGEGIWRLAVDKNFEDITCGPTEKQFLTAPRNKTRIALKSYPGSGNTRVRYLLEEATGIYTGAIYNDRRLSKVLLGEGHRQNVIAIKTHGKVSEKDYDKTILIVRDTFDAVLANYNRKNTRSHTNIVNMSTFDGLDVSNQLNRFIDHQLVKHYYTTDINTFPGDIFVLFYERLKSDLLNSLTKLAAFCKADVTLKRLWCILKNSEGYTYRGEKPSYMSRQRLVDPETERKIAKWNEAIYIAIANNT